MRNCHPDDPCLIKLKGSSITEVKETKGLIKTSQLSRNESRELFIQRRKNTVPKSTLYTTVNLTTRGYYTVTRD